MLELHRQTHVLIDGYMIPGSVVTETREYKSKGEMVSKPAIVSFKLQLAAEPLIVFEIVLDKKKNFYSGLVLYKDLEQQKQKIPDIGDIPIRVRGDMFYDFDSLAICVYPSMVLFRDPKKIQEGLIKSYSEK